MAAFLIWIRGLPSETQCLPTIFNTVASAVVRVMLLEVCAPQEAHHALGWEEGEQEIVFYTGNGLNVGRKPICVREMLTTLIRMFEWLFNCTGDTY